ncbi:capsid triplex subunit 2 [Vespertilionid gammaherpesvirus 1]|uniref:Capsid triplex subunit 2 n=1 Tax=Vespertilionid gammaherpesvirus 1 TaxID=2560830 RepID=A0A0X9YAW9_9GAMA|nr:capsid triplex subunit 2 [Myotis gammaherpesvirus 8]AMA67383.1 capsid triplex subunit 2 [Vespertilionid gammaherpesvirus 1]
MQVDSKIVVSLTSRLFADEISKLQERVGSLLTLQDPHKLQNINSVGLYSVCQKNVAPDFVQIHSYISRATLAILEEVTPDSLVFTRINFLENYQIKNVYNPFFQWDSHTTLSVIPPVFGIEKATVALESNGFNVVFPMVVPESIANMVIQKLLLYNIYAKLHEDEPDKINMDYVRLQTTTINHMGRTYILDISESNPRGVLEIMDNVAMYSCVLAGVLPNAILNLLATTMRQDKHELLEIFEGIEIEKNKDIDIDTDIQHMEHFIAFSQVISSVFNLSPKLRLALYTPDTVSGTCWLISQ